MMRDMDYTPFLHHLGLDTKASTVYLALLALGPSPVRAIAAQSGVNRGTTHQILRRLIELGLVSYYHKQKREYFIAESPDKLLSLSHQRVEEVEEAHTALERELPTIQAIASASDATIVRSYEGSQGIRSVLEDVLSVMDREHDKTYRTYSTLQIRDLLYRSFPNFTKERIRRGVFVRVIAIGEGGDHQQQSQRRWLTTQEHAPTYRILYHDRIALISQRSNQESLRAVVIQDPAMYQTEVLIFEELWKMLPNLNEPQ